MCCMSIVCAQSPIGQWKNISHGAVRSKKMDTHVALVVQRPCVEKIIYEKMLTAPFVSMHRRMGVMREL